jgi:hypothetical protein
MLPLRSDCQWLGAGFGRIAEFEEGGSEHAETSIQC